MPWYAVYDTNTGQLRSEGTKIEPPLLPGLAWKQYAERPDMLWNPATLDYDQPLPAEVPVWTRVDFMMRFTLAERVAIRKAQASDDGVEDIFEMMKLAPSIRADHPMVAQGLAYLVSKSLLTPERAAEIAG